MNRTAASTFKVGTPCRGGCVGLVFWDPFGFCGGCSSRRGRSGIFPVTFVLYSNDLPCEAYHQHHRFYIYDSSTYFLTTWNNRGYILTDWYAWPRWSVISEYNMFSCHIILFNNFKIYCTFHNNIHITIITQIWYWHRSFKLYILGSRKLTTWWIIYFNLPSCHKLWYRRIV